MARYYMSVTDVANYLGIARAAVSNYNLPEPDAYVGKARGWTRATIEKWNANRPGHGGRKPHQ